ncbi:MAG: ABC transporter ATP-binding protein [Candidatus Heimdallarchaeota archaeon]|nr:ABC transporter ATP-binding protein [Candidatus Heimdallarchaeota archaeon]
MSEEQTKILEIDNLHTYFYTEDGIVKAVDGVTLEVYEGEVLGLVGESGSGKTVTAMSILKLIPQPPGKIIKGDIKYKGRSLVDMPESELRTLRGNQLAVVFQDPMTSLNPILTIGEQIAEAIRLHQGLNDHDAQITTIRLLELVGIPDPSKRLGDYPWQFSGGMRQRVMIALALSCNPDLLIADEPTTALDVTIQAQVLDLMQELRTKFKMSIILITHDIGVIAGNCDRVAVMYAGNIVELGDVLTIFKNAKHPYTQGLLGAIPSIKSKRSDELVTIPGTIPNLISPPSGCRFHPRCGQAMPECSEIRPIMVTVGPGHSARCLLYGTQLEEYRAEQKTKLTE